MATDTDQKTLDFNPIEMTEEERARSRRQIEKWTIEEEMEEFQKLPCETVAEYLAARDLHLSQLEAFGPEFKREPKASEAWQIVNGQGRAPPQPRQLTLNFEGPKPAP